MNAYFIDGNVEHQMTAVHKQNFISQNYANKFPEYLLVFNLFILISTTLLLCSVPPVDRDALTHHLFVPKLWLKHGGIYEIQEIPFSYYPMNLDLLYMIPLSFGNDIIPKYIHYCFALLTAGLIFRYLKNTIGIAYGLLGAVFFLSIPIIIKLSITVYVDLGLIFFTTASLLALLHWAEKNFQLRYLLLAGLCCGLAAGTKYNGLISIVVLTLFVPIIYQRSTENRRHSNGRALIYGILFAASTFIAFSPWLIKNYAWTGNPIYPLHNSLFQKDRTQTEVAEQASTDESSNILQQITSNGSSAFTSRKLLYHETWWQALLLPVRFFIEGQDDNPQFFDGKLTPFLLILSISAFLFPASSAKENREKKFFLCFALLFFFLTFFQQALRIRYIAAIIPSLVILSMYGLHGLTTALAKWGERNRLLKTSSSLITAGFVLLMLTYNAQYIVQQFLTIAPVSYVLGKISRNQYITTFRPEYPAIQYANSILPPDAKVLCIFLGNRGYYMDFKPVFEQPYRGGFFSRFLSSKQLQRSIVDEMRDHGISHILFRTDLTASWLKQLSEQDRQRVLPLFASADRPLWSGNGHVVLEVHQHQQ